MSILRTAYLLVLAILTFLPEASAQGDLQKCWIYLTEKDSAGFDPYSYFDSKAIERRKKMGIDLLDPLCWPVNPTWKDSLQTFLHSHTATLRWMNAVVGYAHPRDIERIRNLDFVRRVDIHDYPTETLGMNPDDDDGLNDFEMEVLLAQTEVMGRSVFEASGLTGKGIRIAVLDAGFTGVDTNPVFRHLFERGLVRKTWDFVRDEENAYRFSRHGSLVLSCIGGMFQDTIPMGLAKDAEFMLFRTERDKFEFRGEEENWMEGMEVADKEGADIINSSLGYTRQRYYQFEMNGNTAGVTKAAAIAARLGILVVNAAGNEGDSWWEVIAAPADGDSVLTVGGVDPASRTHTSFSSYGPTSDGRTKPNLSAFAWAIGSSHLGEEYVPGTSFSSPLVAGFAACAWQRAPELTNMDIFRRLERAGHLYPYYDYSHGYGIPQASRYLGLEAPADTTFDVEVAGGSLRIAPRRDETVETEEQLNLSELGYGALPDVLYFHFKNPDDRLSYYADYRMHEGDEFRQVYSEDLRHRKGQIIKIYYKGYLYERKLE